MIQWDQSTPPTPAHWQEEKNQSRGEWKHRTASPRNLPWEHRPTLHGALEIRGAENRSQRLRLQTGSHNQLPWDKRKAGGLKDFSTVRRLLKGQGFRRRNRCTNCPATLSPAGWELSGASGTPSPWFVTQPQGPSQ